MKDEDEQVHFTLKRSYFHYNHYDRFGCNENTPPTYRQNGRAFKRN
jgi:hypothetical protein